MIRDYNAIPCVLLSVLCPAPQSGSEDVCRIGLVLVGQRDPVVLEPQLVGENVSEARKRNADYGGLFVAKSGAVDGDLSFLPHHDLREPLP